MSHPSTSQCLHGLARSFKRFNTSDPLIRCLVPRLSRTVTSVAVKTPLADSDVSSLPRTSLPPTPSQPATRTSLPAKHVLATLYSWPDLEPCSFASYSSSHLALPLRRDLLHRAVVFEGDRHRGWSTASTKYRTAVHGSNRKIAPQKGLGRARVGDKKSPIRRGGGVVFGPHPRDFTTELPKKIYDIAWRTALSYRYRRGELIILDAPMTIPLDSTPWLLEKIFIDNKWGHQHGRSLLVSNRVKEEDLKTGKDEKLAVMQSKLWENMQQIGRQGLIKDLEDVDVKDLLETGRVVIDKFSLKRMLAEHSSDLKTTVTRIC